jgi:transglutaminase-like putative cysteine protease
MTGLRQLRVGCEFVHVAEVETATVLQIEPDSGGVATVVRQEWSAEPEIARHAYADGFGNACQRLTLPEGRSVLRYQALVTVPDATEEIDPGAAEVPAVSLPDEVLVYTLPSRYVVPDMLGDEAWQLFGDLKPGYPRVQAICDHVNGTLTFAYGSTTSTWTAADVRASGIGVCRDFTHLAITYCRALNIPARYVFGYLPELDVPPISEPMDFAAWMEVFLDGRWWTFDPRNNTQRKGRVVVGRGRDAVDVAMVTTYGGPLLESMIVTAEEVT